MICYENRNGIVIAYDPESKLVVVPKSGTTSHPRIVSRRDSADSPWKHEEVEMHDLELTRENMSNWECDPCDLAEELRNRGVKEVQVYTGDKPYWVTTPMTTWDRIKGFAWMARQSKRSRKVWTAVPIDRLDDGSDWSDIYPRLGATA